MGEQGRGGSGGEEGHDGYSDTPAGWVCYRALGKLARLEVPCSRVWILKQNSLEAPTWASDECHHIKIHIPIPVAASQRQKDACNDSSGR